MELAESKPKRHFLVPASLRLLTTPGIRGHSLIFSVVMTAIFAAAYLGRAFSVSGTWTAVFDLGAATGATYLILSLLTLTERTKQILFHSRLQTRLVILLLIYAPLIGGLAYWVNQVGSVEALPIFPAFIIIFYGWVLLQAYFIATPISHLVSKIERGISHNGERVKSTKTFGAIALFTPAVPLVYGVYAISSWLNSTYQNVQGSGEKIIGWTLIITVVLLFTYALALQWGWRSLRGGSPEAAIYVGGTFLLLWGYLLYRATTAAIGYISQSQPSSLVADSALIAISMFGATQTFAGKTVNRKNERLNQLVPFLVFAFGSIYAVAQFYFILQVAITRSELSLGVNSTVFATGVIVLILLVRKRVRESAFIPAIEEAPATENSSVKESIDEPAQKASRFSLPFSRFLKKKHEEETPGSAERANDS